MSTEQVERGVGLRSVPRTVEPPRALEWLQRFAEVSSPLYAVEEWNHAALATGCAGMDLSAAELQRLAEWLVAHCSDQPIRMAARSCLVRLRVHATMLTALGDR
ncbi:hypothetical protein [Kineococcus rhizosphaerae]|uniref:hypothetical protein n=1 Tax=Kineococcus rhizosphaerae TaxID=559628 RepID=UPI0011B1D1E1|nr:hypothetical protein [Kineococcus rhizosphaerae]